MFRRRGLAVVVSLVCVLSLLSPGATLSVKAAAKFDPVFYGAFYPDVTAVFGTDPQALLNHYLTYGMTEGRLPAANAAPGEAVDGIQSSETVSEPVESQSAFQPVPMDKLANLSSLRRKMTDEEFAAAYQAALNLVTPYAGLSREEQIYGITVAIRELCDSGMAYSTSTPHYNDPYGYFILGTASCAGCARATGLCLNILGIPYEHVNENQYSHQWCRVNVDGVYWISDAYGLYCGPEPAPYMHPYLN